MARPFIPRLPVEPLFHRLGTHRISFAAKLLGEVDARNFYRYCKQGGIPVHIADRYAVRLGVTPHEIWGEMYDAIDWRRSDLDTVRYVETDSMTRAQLEAAVKQIAELAGWLTHRSGENRSEGGYPTLILVRPPRLVFVHLKSSRGRMTEAQKRWRNQLLGTEAEWYLWRPADLQHIATLLGRPMTTRDQWISYSTQPQDAA